MAAAKQTQRVGTLFVLETCHLLLAVYNKQQHLQFANFQIFRLRKHLHVVTYSQLTEKISIIKKSLHLETFSSYSAWKSYSPTLDIIQWQLHVDRTKNQNLHI